MAGKLGLVTIGQSPRSDYESVFHRSAPDSEILWAGALDGMDAPQVRRLASLSSEYPLHTGLNDGTTVDIAMDVLLPLVTERASDLARAGAQLVVLVCAGGFPEFECPVPVLLPGNLLPAIVGSISRTRRIGIVTPIPGQIEWARAKWAQDGFDVDVVAASPYSVSETRDAAAALTNPELELIVLDCMGHHSGHQREFAEITGRPVLVAQNLVARVAGEYVSGTVGVASSILR